MRTTRALAIVIVLLALAGTARAAGKTAITWHGHSAFSVRTPGGALILIDPWLTNPKNPAADPMAAARGADYILVTHGHRDHVGDAVAIGKKTGAILVAQYELGARLREMGYPAEQAGMATMMNIGGEITIAHGEARVAMVPALHSSGLSRGRGFVYAGTPCGFVISIKDGPVIYHAGDTGYSAEMAAIGRLHRIDVALLPIGGHFNMDGRAAAMAARDLGARWAVPMHFATFPLLAPNAERFVRGLADLGGKTQPLVLEPGETVTFRGAELVR